MWLLSGKLTCYLKHLDFPLGKLIYWFLCWSRVKADQVISFQEQKNYFCSAGANLLSRNHFLSLKNCSVCSSCPILIWKYFLPERWQCLVCFLHKKGLLVSSLCLTITSCPIIYFDKYVFVSACRVIIEFPSMADNVTWQKRSHTGSLISHC